MSKHVLEKLRERFGTAILETHSDFGDDTAVVEPSLWKGVCQFLRDDPTLAFDLPVDLCGVDYPSRATVSGGSQGRMELVMHLYSVSKRHRIVSRRGSATRTWTGRRSTASPRSGRA